ncbi:MAG: hypothetical protein LBQ90_09235, partial [Synergistaceae bacterium]|nr:hypothetical protein [Synergistaceae bacterium]
PLRRSVRARPLQGFFSASLRINVAIYICLHFLLRVFELVVVPFWLEILYRDFAGKRNEGKGRDRSSSKLSSSKLRAGPFNSSRIFRGESVMFGLGRTALNIFPGHMLASE